MRVLIACEFSGVVRREFAKLGHDTWSCDIIPSDDNSDKHLQCDILDVLNRDWDLMIAHPPCTWLCSAMRTNAARKDRPNITPVFEEKRQEAFDFFMTLYNANIPKIAVENPIGYINGAFRKPDQIIRPWMFGHPYRKDVCLWLKNLPLLIPTDIVEGRKLLDFWSNKRNVDGRSIKSITFQGIAAAMANQWGNII
jgi:hypothetical protein